MYTLYTDKSENFKCNIGVEGASIRNTTARLVLENKNLNLLFEGTVSKDGTCTIPIKQLKNILPEGLQGTMKLEVIADDTFFSPWQDDFTIKVNKKVTVEVMNDTSKTPIKENRVQVKVSGLKKPKPVVKRVKKRSHSQIMSETISKKGITVDNFKENLDYTVPMIKNYIKKFKVNESVNDLLNDVILNLN